MSRHWMTAVALATLVGLAGSRASANPVDAFGMGSRAIGLGGAYGALVDDFSATYYNPGALALGEDLRIELGYIYVAPNLSLNDKDLGVDSVHGVQGGMVLPGKLFGHRLGLALGLYLPDERITRLRALPEGQPRFLLYDNRPQRIVLTTSVGFEVIKDVLFVGAGLTYLSDTKGGLDVAGQVDFKDAAGTALFSAVDVNFEAARYASAGILFTPTERLRVGLTFRDEFDLTLAIGLRVNGDIVLNGTSDDPGVLVDDAALTVVSRNANLFSPRQLALSAAWVEPRWAVAIELTWLQYSRFRTPTSHITFDIDVGDLPLSIPTTPAPRQVQLSDIFVPRVGGEVTLVDGPHFGLTTRAGYWFEPTPAPDQRGRTSFVDSDKHGLGVGLSLRFSDLTEIFPKPFYLDLAGTFVFMTERSYHKEDPADPVGDFVATGYFAGFSTTLKFLF